MKKIILIIFSALFALQPVFAAREPIKPAEGTFWDRLMRSQSYRSMQRGLIYMNMGNYRLASREFGRAATENPKEVWPHLLLGSALYWLGDVTQAVTEFETAIEIDPKEAQGHLLLGIAYAWKGDAQNSLTAFLKAEELAPERPDIQMNLGSLYQAMGFLNKALYHYRRAAELEPRHPLYFFQLGGLYVRLGRDSDAINSFKRALKIFPKYEDAMLELASVYEKNNNFNDALKLYKNAVKTKPQDSVARFRYARLLTEQGQFKEASDILFNAFALTPTGGDDDSIALSLAYSPRKKNKRRQASSSSSENSGGAPADRTGFSDNSDEEDTQLESLRKNLERLPLNQSAKVDIEILYMPNYPMQKKPNEEASNLVSELGQQMAQPQVMAMSKTFTLPVAGADIRRQMIDELINALSNTVSEVPDNTQMRMALNIETSGTGGAKASNLEGLTDEEVINAMANASSRNPANTNRNKNVVYRPRAVGNDMGLWVMGNSWIDLVLEVMPELGEAMHKNANSNLETVTGLGYVLSGDPQTALDYFKKVKHDNFTEVALMGQVVAYSQIGKDEEAKAVCRQILKLNPNNKIAADNLKWLEITLEPAGKDK